MTGWSETELVGQTPPFPYWLESDREIMNERLEEELHGRALARRLPGARQAQERQRVQRPPLRLAADRCARPPDRLDDLDDRHHRAHPHPRAAVGLLRALHHRARGAGRLGVGGSARQRGAAVRQQAVPALVRLRHRRATWAWWRRPACRRRTRTTTRSTMSIPSPACPIDQLTAAQPANNEIFVPELGKWLEVRSRYLTWVDGRLAQTGDRHRHHAAPRCRGAVRRAGRPRPVRQPPDHHGRDGVQRRARAQPAADRHHQLLQRHGVAHHAASRSMPRRLLAALDKTRKQAQRAGQIIQRIRSFVKRSEPNRTPAEVSTDGERSGRAGRHRAAPPQRAPQPLRGGAPARCCGSTRS